jgi:hypothetical protein
MTVIVRRGGFGTSEAELAGSDPLTMTDPDLISSALPVTGMVQVADSVARFIRPGLTEEYSVSVDGVRQDLIVDQRPTGAGELRLEMSVSGAKAAPQADGVRLVLDGSGRALIYHRLHVVDARGQELPARLEVSDATHLAIVVADANAAYPIRIDPTFSDADWVSLDGLPGVDATVNAVAFDGSGNLYIGGSFVVAGKVVANRIAKWDGHEWSDLNGGLNGPVNAIAVSGSNVYVGGAFTLAEDGDPNNGIVISVNNIARWDGHEWLALDAGVGGTVNALAVAGSDLYVGGAFTSASSVAANRVAKWDGLNWSALGVGLGFISGQVNALAVLGGNLYAGGTFGQLGDGTTMTRIARWDGNSWSALSYGIGGGTSPSVNALAVVGTNLYAAGVFTIAGLISPANNIVKWDGTSWSTVGSGLGSTAYALTVSGTNLYVGGAFTTAGGNPANRIARWDGQVWSALDTGMSGTVTALAAAGDAVAAGGSFTSRPGMRVATWNGAAWTNLGSGLAGSVNAIAISGNDVYVGGGLKFFGLDGGYNIVHWNGSTWSALGGGLNGGVYALVVTDGSLYAGGAFTTATNAGGASVMVNRIAQWNGAAWTNLDAGMNNTVGALAVAGGEVYAGGAFTAAGGNPAYHLVRWNGTSWAAVGAGMDGNVNALVPMGADLFAAGTFLTATNSDSQPVPANRIAKWNGSAWVPLGTGVTADVNALAVNGATLYAGGLFGNAGGVSVGRIAQWDGNSWAAIGDATNNIFVNALAVSGGDLYVGGIFTSVAGVPADNIAKWDGSAWTALGSGVSAYGSAIPSVNALAVGADGLYVGGTITRAGTQATAAIARATISGAIAPGRFANLVYAPGAGLSFIFTDGTPGQAYRIQSAPALGAAGWTTVTNFTYTAPMVITDPVAGAGPARFYRAVTP